MTRRAHSARPTNLIIVATLHMFYSLACDCVSVDEITSLVWLLVYANLGISTGTYTYVTALVRITYFCFI